MAVLHRKNRLLLLHRHHEQQLQQLVVVVDAVVVCCCIVLLDEPGVMTLIIEQIHTPSFRPPREPAPSLAHPERALLFLVRRTRIFGKKRIRRQAEALNAGNDGILFLLKSLIVNISFHFIKLLGLIERDNDSALLERSKERTRKVMSSNYIVFALVGMIRFAAV